MTPDQAREFRRLYEDASDAISDVLALLADEAVRLNVPAVTVATLLTSQGFHIATAAVENFIAGNGARPTRDHFLRLARIYAEKGTSESVERVLLQEAESSLPH
jgi:hypothetical protein